MMKTTFFSLVILCALFCLPKQMAAQSHVTMSIQNPTSTANTLEYDIYIVNDGTTSLALCGYQFGVNFALYVLNGGTPASSAYTYIAGTRDPIFASLNAMSVQYNNQQLRAVSTNVPSVNAATLATGVQYRLGRFRFTNTVSWFPSSLPNLQLQLPVLAGKTQAVAVCFVNGATTNTPLTFAGTTLNGVSNAVGFILNVPLPVTLTDFSGKIIGRSDLIKWTTSDEKNNSHFNLQYSTDGIHFTTIQKVNSKGQNGNSATPLTYEYTNSNTQLDHNYYRLEQVDIDGKSTIETKILDLQHMTKQGNVSFYPNPATNVLNVNIDAEKVQNTLIKLSDMNGRTVKSISAISSFGNNNIEINIADISSGNYLLQVYANNVLQLTDKVNKQ